MSTEERFEKTEASIRDLIVVSRTLLESQKEVTGQIQGITGQIQGIIASIEDLRDAQKHTDQVLNALIQAQIETEHKIARTDQNVARLAETVERILRDRGSNGAEER